MDSIQKECLIQNHTFLVNYLDPRDVIDFLYQERQITPEELHDLSQASGGTQRKANVRSLLQSLMKSRYGLIHLLKALESTEVHHDLYNKLKGSYELMKHDPSNNSVSQNRCDDSTLERILRNEQMSIEEQSQPPRYSNIDNPPQLVHAGPCHVLDSVSQNIDVVSRSCSCLECSVQTHPKCTEHRLDLNLNHAELDYEMSSTNSPTDKRGFSKQTLQRNYQCKFAVQCSDENPSEIIDKQSDLLNFSSAKHNMCERESGSIPSSTPIPLIPVICNVDPTLKFLDELSNGGEYKSSAAVSPGLNIALSVDDTDSALSEYDGDGELNEESDGFSDDEGLVNIYNPHVAVDMLSLPKANLYVDKRNARRLTILFDELSTLINQGKSALFNDYRRALITKNSMNNDLKFMLLYLSASAHLWKNEYDKCESVVQHALQRIQRVSRPSRALVEILSSRAWMFFQEKKFNRLQQVLDVALQTISQSPLDCVGKAAGWIYVDKARLLSALMTGRDKARILRMRKEGIECLEQAIQHFNADDSRDGPFGFGFAGIMLASFLLLCGDRLQTLHVDIPHDDVIRAREMITKVEDSPFGVTRVLLVHILLAKCDYNMRKGPEFIERATEFAEEATETAKELTMPELLEYADIRNNYLKQTKRENDKISNYSMSSYGMKRETGSKPNTCKSRPKESTSTIVLILVTVMIAIVACMLMSSW